MKKPATYAVHTVRTFFARSAAIVPGLLLAVSLSTSPAFGDVDLRVVTEEFPPFDFTGDGGRVEGLATDVVRAVLSDLDLDVEIEILPWARAFKMARTTPGTMLYSVVRTHDREDDFHWVGVVCEVKSYLFRLRERTDIKSGDISELRGYSVGVVRGWAGQDYLERNGFSQLQLVVESDANIKKLISGRVDLIEDYETNLLYRMRKLDLDPSLVEKVYFNADISGPLYAVFNKDTDPRLVERFRDAFSSLHLDGRYESIQQRWR